MAPPLTPEGDVSVGGQAILFGDTDVDDKPARPPLRLSHTAPVPSALSTSSSSSSLFIADMASLPASAAGSELITPATSQSTNLQSVSVAEKSPAALAGKTSGTGLENPTSALGVASTTADPRFVRQTELYTRLLNGVSAGSGDSATSRSPRTVSLTGFRSRQFFR